MEFGKWNQMVCLVLPFSRGEPLNDFVRGIFQKEMSVATLERLIVAGMIRTGILLPFNTPFLKFVQETYCKLTWNTIFHNHTSFKIKFQIFLFYLNLTFIFFKNVCTTACSASMNGHSRPILETPSNAYTQRQRLLSLIVCVAAEKRSQKRSQI